MEINLEYLVIELIQYLKHNQLILGLDRLNLDAGYCHYLGILDLIQRLMGVPEEFMDDFSTSYMSYMQRCLEFPITPSGEELRELAVECYDNLRALMVGESVSWLSQGFVGLTLPGRATALLPFQSFSSYTSLPKKGFPLLSLSHIP